MLAKLVDAIPSQERVEGGVLYEPKWDGFRGIVYFDGTDVEIGSRGSKPLTRYFPELVELFKQQLPEPCILDGEIVVRVGSKGAEHLDWETLSARIHPAASRVAKLAVETPASFVAFDLLSQGGESLLDAPFEERRAALEKLLARATAPLHLTQTTRDVAVANRWLEEFEGAGLDGVVTKPLALPYGPGKRTMFKTKHARTADVVLLGYRVHKSGAGVGSLLLGLYADAEFIEAGPSSASGTEPGSGTKPRLLNVGGASAFSDARRRELVEELAPLVKRDESGDIVKGETERSRFSASKDVSYVALEPTRVVEVAYDQMEGMRFRHTVQFVRWRPDREATSCTFEQLDRPISYDLAEVLAR
jgi:ATP-dependent DNA ligase